MPKIRFNGFKKLIFIKIIHKLPPLSTAKNGLKRAKTEFYQQIMHKLTL